MKGYWNNPEATRETLRGGWLHTGDLGVMDEDGFVTLKDRSKDMIISGGTNIYPREIEEVLLRHPAVLEASVVGRPHPEWGEEVVAFVVATAPGARVPESELDALCLEHIARFKRPRDYRFIDSLPKNNYGKVLKTELPSAARRRGGLSVGRLQAPAPAPAASPADGGPGASGTPRLLPGPAAAFRRSSLDRRRLLSIHRLPRVPLVGDGGREMLVPQVLHPPDRRGKVEEAELAGRHPAPQGGRHLEPGEVELKSRPERLDQCLLDRPETVEPPDPLACPRGLDLRPFVRREHSRHQRVDVPPGGSAPRRPRRAVRRARPRAVRERRCG